MYEIIWTPKALERLSSLEKQVANRIAQKVEQAKEMPHHYFEKLVEVEGRRMRVGDYRVITDIDDANQKIFVNTIGHRKNVYKR